MQPLDQIYWREFHQSPSCNYTWTYEVHMRDDESIKKYSKIGKLPLTDMRSFKEINPPVMLGYSS